jgi:hypothetical protein
MASRGGYVRGLIAGTAVRPGSYVRRMLRRRRSVVAGVMGPVPAASMSELPAALLGTPVL